MKTRFLLAVCLLFSIGASAQSNEGRLTLDVTGGWAGTMGNMTKPNPSLLSHNGVWHWGIGLTKFSWAGKLGKKDMVAWRYGYDFQYNYLDKNVFAELSPMPEEVDFIRRNQLVHGPYVKFEYTADYPFQPFIGIGGHLTAVRASEFEFEYAPDMNYYQKVEFVPGGWGRLNPSFTAHTGFRILFPSSLSLSFQYEIFLRNTWTSRYNVTATPYVADGEVLETSQFVTQLGWMHRIDLQLNIPLN